MYLLPSRNMNESPLQIVPAAGIDGVENCVVVNEGEVPELLDIVSAAVKNKAHIDNNDDEAGDDLYAVQFPGQTQELLERDAIAGRIRELMGEVNR